MRPIKRTRSGTAADVEARHTFAAAARRTSLAFAVGTALVASTASQAELEISQVPLFLNQGAKPIAMLNMSNDHQFYFQAYPDYADLTGDGEANRTYEHSIDYYGYFDSFKCYDYSSGQFNPVSETEDKYCNSSSGAWSGNFLNWISMARIDTVRKILYGGYRYIDEDDETVLERTYLPNDSHSWQRYYDGDDLPKLSPFNLPQETTGASGDVHDFSAGEKEFDTTLRGDDVDLGDQLVFNASATNRFLVGVVTEWDGDDGELEVQVSNEGVNGTGSSGNWEIVNLSRRGVTFCNTTASNTRYSQNVEDPPLIRVASGNYSLWTGNERWQCNWDDEAFRTGHANMRIGGISFSNGNDAGFTGIFANADNPRRDVYGLGNTDYNVRVSVCEDGLIGEEDCKRYPDGNYKPIGLLQEFGDTGQIDFGLMSGTYARNKSGGVLRRNAGSIADEVNVDTDGTFRLNEVEDSIVDTIDRFRMYGYSHNNGTYNDGGGSANCGFVSNFSEGTCNNWGNPQSEMMLETLRYFGGLDATSAFQVGNNDRIDGLGEADWEDPVGNDNWCAPLNVINFNSSSSAFDADSLDGFGGFGAGSVDSWTDAVGAGEGIHGNEWFIGESGGDADQFCTAKNIGALSSALGICPEVPRREGSFQVAGLAHFAWTNDIRSDVQGEQSIKTHGVSLAPADARIEIPRPGSTEPSVTILPACENARSSEAGRCALADFRIISQDVDAGTGSFMVTWDVHEYGADFDMDINGVISYEFTSSGNLEVTTRTFAQSSSRPAAFGYVISGTSQDGFHAHSGINNYSNTDSTGVLACNNCQVSDAPTSHEFTVGSGSAGLLEQPLYYAAKWGGYDRDAVENGDLDFPDDPETWQDPDTGRPANHYFSADPRQLAEDLRDVFQSVASAIGSAAAVAANTTQASGDALLYQARFNSEDWTGDVAAFEINADGTVDSSSPIWQAASRIPQPTNRQVYASAGTGRLEDLGDLPSRADVFNDAAAGIPGATGEDLFEYVILGDDSNERRNGGPLRNRPVTVMGDIVNSTPFVTRGSNFGYSILPGDEGDDYPGFLDEKREWREMLYVGSNAGMLHAIDATASGGNEMFSFVPDAVFEDLPNLADPDYVHQFYVDGQIRVADAYYQSDWEQFLVGSAGAGARSVFGLTVSDPTTFNDADIRFELSGDDHDGLGHVLGNLHVVKLNDGTWAALFGNGYNSDDQTAQLFLVPLENPDDPIVLDTGVGGAGSPNGLGGVTPADTNGDGTADIVYGGDLEGNLWRFDLTSTNSNQWGQDVLFEAEDRDDNAQPITAAPAIARHSDPDVDSNVLVGTGRSFVVGDGDVGADPQVQTFYAIQDDGTGSTVDRDDLLEQEVEEEGVGSDGTPFRELSTRSLGDENSGWRIDLIFNEAEGEQVVDPAAIVEQRVFFLSQIPEVDPCAFGGRSWLYEMDLESGAQTNLDTFDDVADSAGSISFDQLATGLSGLRGDGVLTFYPSLSDASIEDIETEISRELYGRQSWRELR